MKFISVQPATVYYSWQVETYLTNFIGMGINPHDIIIILGINPSKTDDWKKIENRFNNVEFHYYIDDRPRRNYIPSIRSFLLAKHWEKYPDLEKETIFYHDSDILFTKPFDWDRFSHGETWYLSNTKSYLGAKYIRSKGEQVLNRMCSIVGISKGIVIKNEENSGGAQYIMKGLTRSFWERVYTDSENLYSKISIMNKTIMSTNPDYHPLQIWCADMWAVYWNGLKLNKTIKTPKEMEFSWATSNISEWDKKIIYHNAGVNDNKSGLFFKADYINQLPYGTDLDISQHTCSGRYYDFVKEVGKNSSLI